MSINAVVDFNAVGVTALLPTPAFVLEGGRLAAIQKPTGGELCPKQGPNSASQSIFGFKGRSSVMAGRVADARTYTFRSGSNALGGTG